MNHSDHPRHDVDVKKVERLSPTRVKLTLAFSSENVRAHEEMTLRQYQQKARISGFRPGKAPLQMIKKRFQDNVTKDVLSHLLDAGLNGAIERTKFIPVSRPKVQVLETGFNGTKPLEFSVEYEIQPEIEMRHYKGIPVPTPPVEVKPEEISHALEGVRHRFAILEPVYTDHVAAGQFAIVEMGYEVAGDPPVREAPSTFPVEVTKNRILPELEKALLEMKLGEVRKIPLRFPSDYHKKELIGREAIFECKLLEVKKKVLPEPDDVFASQVREGLTLDQLKREIEDGIRENHEEDAKKIQREAIVDYLIQKNPFDVPASLVEGQAALLLQNVQEEMGRRGLKVDSLKPNELDEIRKRAEKMVRAELALREVEVKEKISIDENRVNQRLEAIAKSSQRSVDDTKKYLSGKGLLNRIRNEVLTDQAFDFLLQHAEMQK